MLTRQTNVRKCLVNQKDSIMQLTWSATGGAPSPTTGSDTPTPPYSNISPSSWSTAAGSTGPSRLVRLIKANEVWVSHGNGCYKVTW